jgi:hypothetical protein
MQISNDAKLNMAYDIPEGSVGRGRGQVPCGGAPPPPPVNLEQLLATHNDLMMRLVENDERRGAERQQPRHQEMDSSYSDFLATHPPVFADVTNPLEVDSGQSAEGPSEGSYTTDGPH